MSTQVTSVAKPSVYRNVIRNRSFMLLWSGGTLSLIGDSFFNLAVMWVIYTASHSFLQTSFVQVIWQLDRILFGTIAGVFADRWNRKRIMILVNLLQALLVGALAAQIGVSGHVSRVPVFATLFVLNTLNTFFLPSSSAVMPEIVGREALATAQGLLSMASNVTSLIGEGLAGLVLGALGAVGSISIDAISFLFPAAFIAISKFPKSQSQRRSFETRPSFIREIKEGWRTIAGLPIVKAMVWLAVLVNVASFAGPLYPGVVQRHLHSGPAVLGYIGAAGVIGGALGGLSAGFVERKLGAGKAFVLGWLLGGAARVGFAFTTWLPLAYLMSALARFA